MQEPVSATTDSRRPSHVDWAAILAGAAIAAGGSVVFSGFTAALGLGSVSAEPGQGMGRFALILTGFFAFLTMIAVYALGGYVAGRMRAARAGAEDETEARDGVHGLTVWAIGVILSGMVAASAVSGGVRAAGGAAQTAVEAGGTAVGGALQGAGQLAGGVAGGVGDLAGGVIGGAGEVLGGAASGLGDWGGNPLDYISDRFLRSEATSPEQFTDEAIRRELAGILGSVLRTGEVDGSDLDYLRSALAARTQLTPAQIDARVAEAVQAAQQLRAEAEARLADAQVQAEAALADAQAQARQLQAEAEEQLRQARDAAIEAAETARRAAVWTALFLAVSALVAGLAAWMGAIRGGHDRDAGRMWNGLRRRRV